MVKYKRSFRLKLTENIDKTYTLRVCRKVPNTDYYTGEITRCGLEFRKVSDTHFFLQLIEDNCIFFSTFDVNQLETLISRYIKKVHSTLRTEIAYPQSERLYSPDMFDNEDYHRDNLLRDFIKRCPMQHVDYDYTPKGVFLFNPSAPLEDTIKQLIQHTATFRHEQLRKKRN